uniref:Uncharacterized protein n=1 Tax=Avena sativa TaxID=4498 RepID=A0ACD5VUF4_AVESA
MRNRRRRRRRAKEEAEARAKAEEVPDACRILLPKLSRLSIKGEEGKPRSRILDARALRRSLQGQIRVYFLDAISRLPTADLNTTLARGLLIAGHCYGSLHPVHNILLNSIWYSAAFPLRPGDRIDVNVINDTAISRIVRRSLDGLVSFLRHHCPGLSDDDALWHLSLSGADLRAAVASARGAAPSLLPPAEPEAFQAAARAARHPKPAALALFASSVLPSVERDAVSLLNNKRRLSSADILRLSTMLLPSPLPDELPHPPLRERCMEAFQIIARRRNNLIRWYRRWVEMADAALCKYAQQTAAHYQLHIIYGLGTLQDDACSRHQSYHINFMAWPKDPSSARDAPVFFFAEARGPSGSVFCEEDITLCCIVQPSPSEVDDSENFGGGQYFKMDGISKDWECPVALDVDYRCFDPDRDVDLVEYLDQDYADYISSSAWHSPHKKEGSVLGYCSGIM